MKKGDVPEWEKYKVGIPSKKKNWTNENCQPFDTVRHIAHIRDAIRIMEDGLIRSSLVWDKSRLNNSRTSVSWVSPNFWGPGSIYGNISFEFEWEDLIREKRFYWVEDVIDVRPFAYRILVTDNNYDKSDILFPYDYEKPNGPIYYDGNIWYRNGIYNGELMIDSDLPLNICKELRFVTHRPGICAKYGGGCSDIEISEYSAGPIFLAILIGRRKKISRRTAAKLFMKKDSDTPCLTVHMKAALSYLISDLETYTAASEPSINIDFADSVLRAALVSYGEDNMEDAVKMLELIGSKELLLNTLNNVLSDYFDIRIDCINY